MKKNKADLKLD